MSQGLALTVIALVILAANEWSVRRLLRERDSARTWLTVRLALVQAVALSVVCGALIAAALVSATYRAASISGALGALSVLLTVRYVRLQPSLTRPDPPGDRLFAGFERPSARRAVGATSVVCVALVVVPPLLALAGVPGAARFWTSIGPPALLVALIAVPAYVVSVHCAR